MSGSHLVRGAYAAALRATAGPRAIEAHVFAKITAALRSAERDKSHPALIAALADNQRLWTLLAADVADARNALDPALRAQIFFLADFTRAHTRRILNGDAAARAGVLADINANVMAGLAAGAA